MDQNQRWANELLTKVVAKYRWVAAKTGDKIPYTTDKAGNFDNHSLLSGPLADQNNISWWTNGFYPGLLWQLYTLEPASVFQTNAQNIEMKLATSLQLFDGLSHDVGFMFFPTSVYHYALTGDQLAKTRAMHAATILAGRYNIAGHFIKAWNPENGVSRAGWVIIDSLMNLELLYWASAQSQDPRFALIADAHAHTVAKYFIRANGSVKHICQFDPATGIYLQSLGGQGYGHGSAWTRGQAWAIYGLTACYARTGTDYYRQQAQKVAAYVLSQLPKNLLVPIDFNQPAQPAWIDSSAQAILASGLLSLAQVTEDTDSQHYYQTAVALLKTLVAQCSDFSKACDNLITKASAQYHEPSHEYPIIYADYYFVEALLKLTKQDLAARIWQKN
ncbi:hypothetical protein FC83_GL000345 [Agrilactobacillus composti DSM 18527 = JCM 14202]|uniref:Glycosyl hydrolase family 88 n=1 Tax=Agrilactobacillus composti DSM 18527 = JCM 14202 TaxID=1423734 RepID=X0PQA5_9LACO|nr:glycoside hydrolase family 88 protein [Agrilactobacillus composti]KRM32480.1 hypothetical protein FC83_GL000345 [Agrilactobacillus composti DSM 18527 = JCM 14202]GAF39912.1 glucuronyl hydrolase [Agrilactobacillus composti DSM 18527 = JCM 14202]